MNNVLNILLVIIAMISLIIEKSSCFEILVVGLLLGIMFELEKGPKIKLNRKKGNEE